MPDFVIQLHADEYHDFARYLRAMDYRPIVLRTSGRRFHSVVQILGQYAFGCIQLIARLRELREARTLVVFSHFALVVKLLATYPRWTPVRVALRAILVPGDFVMMRKQLLTLKELAEGDAR